MKVAKVYRYERCLNKKYTPFILTGFDLMTHMLSSSLSLHAETITVSHTPSGHFTIIVNQAQLVK
jgi:hypothetical protein